MPSLAVLQSFIAVLSVVRAATYTNLAPETTSSYPRDFLKARVLLARSGSSNIDDLAFCYGDNSICEESNNLFDKCDAFENNSDLSQWYQCLCENGFVSTREACYWCDDAFGISGDEGDLYSTQCSSYSFTIAPIPSSIIALESSYNATFTGTMPAGVTLMQGGGSGSSSVTTSVSGAKQTSISSASGNSVASRTSSSSGTERITSAISTSTFTLNGGGVGSTPTAQGTTSQAAIQTPTQAGARAGGSMGLSCMDGLVLSLIMFGLSLVFVV